MISASSIQRAGVQHVGVQHIVVIGAGLAGLASAIRLRAKGYRVTLLEATDQPGGRASVFRQDGFTFDAGPTVVTAPYLFDELFQLVGRDPADYYRLVPVDPFYRVSFPDGTVFDYVGDEERLIAQIEKISPRDVEGYRKLAAHAHRIFDVGYSELVDASFQHLSDMLRVVPAMMRLESYRTVYGLVAKYIKDARLRQVFTFQPLLVGGNPFHTTSIYMLIHWLERKWGVHFAMGGTTSLVHAMAGLLGELDVEIRLSSPVDEIEVESGRVKAVRTAHGETIACDLVVSNADPSFVYTRLIDKRHRRKHTDSAVARKRQSMSLFVAYFGTRKTYPDLAHHSILLGPRYKGLLEDIFNRRVLADDFSLYLHAPTRTDPSMAPAGSEAFYVLSPVPNQLSGVDWAEEQGRYWNKILTFLDEGALPGLKDNLVTLKCVDPRYFENQMRSVHGAAFGLEPRLTQSAWFRYHNASDDVKGLYFVGAGTHPGAGMPGVLNSAKVIERVIEAPAVPLPLPAAPAIRRAAL